MWNSFCDLSVPVGDHIGTGIQNFVWNHLALSLQLPATFQILTAVTIWCSFFFPFVSLSFLFFCLFLSFFTVTLFCFCFLFILLDAKVDELVPYCCLSLKISTAMSSSISQSYSIFEGVGGLSCRAERLGRMKGSELELPETFHRSLRVGWAYTPRCEKRPPVLLDELWGITVQHLLESCQGFPGSPNSIVWTWPHLHPPASCYPCCSSQGPLMASPTQKCSEDRKPFPRIYSLDLGMDLGVHLCPYCSGSMSDPMRKVLQDSRLLKDNSAHLETRRWKSTASWELTWKEYRGLYCVDWSRQALTR